MNVDLITVPFHLDRRDTNTGNGPQRLLQAGAEDVLSAVGHDVRRTDPVSLRDDSGETGNIFSIARELAGRVSSAKRDGAAPIVFAGDCYNAIGVMSGLDAASTGLVWFDAHGDANTPETTESGFFDGFPLAVVVGWCWRTLAATVPGFVPLDEERVIHIGGRAFDPQEETLMRDSRINLIPASEIGGTDGDRLFEQGLERLAPTQRVHVHFDLDVIDESDGHASAYAVGDGPSLDQLEAMIRAVGERCNVGSATLCAYDPDFDGDGRAAQAGMRMLQTLGEVLA